MNNKKLATYLVLLINLMVYPYVYGKNNTFPTIDRVLYVNECIREHGGGLDSLYKCSCVMDYFIENLTYEEFDNMDASSHGINTTGERSAIWRDPKGVRDGISRLKDVQSLAKKKCNLNKEN
ncbi:MAG: hypothetical protein CBC60_05100 [Betaproteobacteria bacterium TMED100]|nr:MAG: hypothetical protein CBC60_05100 [Betaproteobacteria bacterium TMED100]|tara:strand:+ start:454 stop:819 length:366 start_codon:yes stop_codon:yes gene_type:complete